MFTVRDAVRNNTGSTPVKLSPYGLISRTGTPQVGGYYILHEGLIGYLGRLAARSRTTARSSPAKPHGIHFDRRLARLYRQILADRAGPAAGRGGQGALHAHRRGRGRPLPDRLSRPPKSRSRPTARRRPIGPLFRRRQGGQSARRLYRLGHSACSICAIDFGWFYFLTKPIFLTLQFFYGLLGNFGLAILLLTLLVKLLFFPLANKSYKAMSKMKLLQPEMQKIRERFPDDKARQQQEMMALYKRVGANPLAGCLPIVIQIPVFFSLYKVLFVTIEMRHAPFFGWIHDLSAPDPTTFFNLFGLLPLHRRRIILMIGAWPLIMGVTMFLQQKLNPQPVDPVQARMFMLLPIVFTYMLVGLPGRAGDLLGVEQSAQHRPAMGDHAPGGRGLTEPIASEPVADLGPVSAARARRRRGRGRPASVRARVPLCRRRRRAGGAARRRACPRSRLSAAPMSASRASSTR